MIYLKQWHRTGITYTNHLLDKNFNFQRVFQLHVPFTTYYDLISAIPPSWTPTHRNPNWKWTRVWKSSCAYKFHHQCCLRSNYRLLLPTSNCWTQITTIRFHERKFTTSLSAVTTLETKLQIFNIKLSTTYFLVGVPFSVWSYAILKSVSYAKWNRKHCLSYFNVVL